MVSLVVVEAVVELVVMVEVGCVVKVVKLLGLQPLAMAEL